jgi:hypothetical protein
MPIFGLTGAQVEKAGVVVEKGKKYFLSMPLIPNAGFEPFVYSQNADGIRVEKEITMTEAFTI